MSFKGKYFYGHARVVPVGVATLALGTSDEVAVFNAPFKCRIKKVGVVFNTAVTGAATNNFGVRYKNKGSGGTGTSVIATKTFSSGVNAAQFDFVNLGNPSNNDLQENDTVTFEKFETGSGLEMPDCLAVIEYVKTG